jgi:hypothetical protein
MIKRLALWGILGLVVGLAGCRSPHVITVTATPPSPTQAVSPLDFPPGVNPLTGLPVDDPSVLDRRPLAIKISNAPDIVRPQAGIGAADLVFEHYVEGHLTRFTAIFWTNTPPRVGSIRSARLIDLELLPMYGALFSYSGASEPIRQLIAAAPFAPRAYEGVSVGEPLYYRDPTIEAPHNLFVIPAAVWDRAEREGIDTSPTYTNGMAFLNAPPAAARPANRLTIDYGPELVSWQYDAETGRYERFVDGEPHRDANTGEQISAANVVVIYAFHEEDTSIVESEWQGRKDYSIHIQLMAFGPVKIFRDGRFTQGYWGRWEENSMLSFWTDRGLSERLYLKPGNTWFQVVPLDFAEIVIG